MAVAIVLGPGVHPLLLPPPARADDRLFTARVSVSVSADAIGPTDHALMDDWH